jgi:hypothetical protein
MKLSDYLIKQSELWGSPLPDPVIQKLRALDGSNLLSSAGTTNPVATVAMTVSPMAQAIWNNFGAKLADAFVPPAAAAERPMATMGNRSIRSSTGQRAALIQAARTLGIRPVDLAAVMSLETGGTYAKDIQGGDGGRYRGLIQFGPSEQKTYGYRPGMSFEQQLLGPVVRYLKARGVKPGHTAQELYAAILTGNVANIAQGGLDWKDSNGTSVRKALPSLTRGGHYQNAIRFLRES